MDQSLEKSYLYCLNITRKHYENFPVASILIPSKKRKHIAAIYTFARIADDIADEGNLELNDRVKLLIEYLELFFNKKEDERYPHFPAVIDTIEKNKLSLINFRKLIEAFIQDNQKFYYDNWLELLDYCDKSANPIGRIILELFEIKNEETFKLSDKICSALQLTNFWQDLKIDLSRNRYYIPIEVLQKHDININNFRFYLEESKIEVKKALAECVYFTRNLFEEGKTILNYLKGFLRSEIKLTILGGQEILNKIEKWNYEITNVRHKLNKLDWLKILLRSFYG